MGKGQWQIFLKLLAPFAPHLAEELWRAQRNDGSIHLESWPVYDAAHLADSIQTIAVQIDGKTRRDYRALRHSKELVEKSARDAVGSRLEGKNVARTIYVAGRIVNFALMKE